MPLYYFHVTHNRSVARDRKGVDLPNAKAAWDEATRTCGEIIRDLDGRLSIGKDWLMQVDDGDGPLFRIHFGAEKLR